MPAADPIDAYLEKHQIAPMLDGIVNELVAEMPPDRGQRTMKEFLVQR